MMKMTEQTTLAELHHYLGVLGNPFVTVMPSHGDETVWHAIVHLPGTGTFHGDGTMIAEALEEAFSELRRATLPEPLQVLADSGWSDVRPGPGGALEQVRYTTLSSPEYDRQHEFVERTPARLACASCGREPEHPVHDVARDPAACSCSPKYRELGPGRHAAYCPFAGQPLACELATWACLECRGCGAVRDRPEADAKPCTACGGTGRKLEAIAAVDLLPPGATLPHWACRTCGGCGRMTTCDALDPRSSKPCTDCDGTGSKLEARLASDPALRACASCGDLFRLPDPPEENAGHATYQCVECRP